MDTIDNTLKLVSLISAILGIIAILLDRLSLRRRIYNEEIRQLQLIKIRYEIEKLIQDGNLSPELYRSIDRAIDDKKHPQIRSPFFRRMSNLATSSPLEIALLFIPSALTLVIAIFLSGYIRYGNDNFTAPWYYYFIWFLAQVFIALPLLNAAYRGIDSRLIRVIVSLSLGIIVFLVTGGLAFLGIVTMHA